MISALGLDLGHRRIGVAGCDRTGLIASGLTTIHRTSFEQDIAQLRQLIQEREVTLLVIGLPYSMNGEIGTQAKRTQKLARRISNALQLPMGWVEFMCCPSTASVARWERSRDSHTREAISRCRLCLLLT